MSITVLTCTAVTVPSFLTPIFIFVEVECLLLPAKNSSSLFSSSLTGLPVLIDNKAARIEVRVSSLLPYPAPITGPITVILLGLTSKAAAKIALSA